MELSLSDVILVQNDIDGVAIYQKITCLLYFVTYLQNKYLLLSLAYDYYVHSFSFRFASLNLPVSSL